MTIERLTVRRPASVIPARQVIHTATERMSPPPPDRRSVRTRNWMAAFAVAAFVVVALTLGR